MKKPRKPSAEKSKTGRKGVAQTAWHPLFAEILSFYLPAGYRLLSEYQLTREPQRVDVVIWEAESEGGPFEGLPALMSRLSPRNLIEFKSPKDQVERTDMGTLTGYALQYYVLEQGFSLRDLSLFLVAPQLNDAFKEGLSELQLQREESEPGIHRCTGFPCQIWCLETDLLWQLPQNQPLGFFTHDFVKEPQLLSQASELPLWMFPWLVQQLAHFRERSREMPLSHREEFLRKMDEFLASLSLEDRLMGTPVEEALKVFTPEKIFRDYPLEEILKHLPIEELLKGLPPEERLKGLPPEERLRGLPPEERLKGLSPEERQSLKKLLEQDEPDEDS